MISPRFIKFANIFRLFCAKLREFFCTNKATEKPTKNKKIGAAKVTVQ